VQRAASATSQRSQPASQPAEPAAEAAESAGSRQQQHAAAASQHRRSHSQPRQQPSRSSRASQKQQQLSAIQPAASQLVESLGAGYASQQQKAIISFQVSSKQQPATRSRSTEHLVGKSRLQDSFFLPIASKEPAS